MSRSSKGWFVLALVVVFFAGAATGFFGAALHLHHRFVVRHGAQLDDRMREHLRRELELTPAQAAQIDPIIDRTTKQLETIRTETNQRVSQTMSQSREEIAPLLKPEQRERLDRMHQRHLHMLERHHFGPPRPEDEPPPDGAP